MGKRIFLWIGLSFGFYHFILWLVIVCLFLNILCDTSFSVSDGDRYVLYLRLGILLQIFYLGYFSRCVRFLLIFSLAL
jgi:hypothetical protein